MRKIYELEFEGDRLYFENFDIGRKFLESKGYKMLLIDQSYSHPCFSWDKHSAIIDWNKAQCDFDDFVFDAKDIHLWAIDDFQCQKQVLFYKNVHDFGYFHSSLRLEVKFVYESENDL